MTFSEQSKLDMGPLHGCSLAASRLPKTMSPCHTVNPLSIPDLEHQLCSSRPPPQQLSSAQAKSPPFLVSKRSPRRNVSSLCDVQGNLMNAGHKPGPGTAKWGYTSALQVTYLAHPVSLKARCSVEYERFHWSHTQVIAFRQACLNNYSETSLSLVLLTGVVTGGGFSISVVGSNGKVTQNGKRLWSLQFLIKIILLLLKQNSD